MLNKKQLFTILGILVSLLFVGLLAFSLFLRENLESYLFAEIQAYGVVFSFLISAILELIPQYVAPHFVLLNIAVFRLSSLIVLFVVMAGSAIGSLAGFELGRRKGFDFACSLYGVERLNKTKKMINSHGKWIITLAAVSPVPYLPIVFGSLGMSLGKFFFYGMIPRAIGLTAVYVFATM